MRARRWRPWAALALALAASAAAAHDTWFERRPDALALGTGAHFPRLESSIGPIPLDRAGCRGATGVQPLRALRDTAQALLLALPQGLQTQATTCWAQSPAFELELDDRLVAQYLDEIRASTAVRATWAEQQRRGVRWVERYVKHARVELGPAEAAPPPAAVAMGLDIVLESARPRTGEPLCLRVLRDERPLPGQAIQLVSGRVAAGFWLQTDTQGRACVRVPLAGSWLLRGTELRPDPDRRDAWVSRFVTLAFEVPEA